MKERPILFSAAMVRAILAGTKNQTRRVLRPQPVAGWAFETPPVLGRITSPHPKRDQFGVFIRRGVGGDFPETDLIACPYGQTGDRLWVRETFSYSQPPEPAVSGALWYWADGNPSRGDWTLPKPSIHMPRWASRITLEITGVRVERLQDISVTDAWAEGIPHSPDVNPAHEFQALWESINGTESWEANPWVWVVEFKKLEA